MDQPDTLLPHTNSTVTAFSARRDDVRADALFGTYARAPVRFVRGEGAWLIDASGERYLDFTSGIAVTCLGHAHPHLAAALKQQADTLWHTSNLFEIDGAQQLSGRLCEATFADKVFFTNSGAEALECAIKTARRFHYSAGRPERSTIVTFEGAFHGRTLGTIAAGGNSSYLEGFGPKAPGFESIKFEDKDALNAAIEHPACAGVLIEPIQGEGGVRQFPDAFLHELREACDRLGILLIFDEVQSGVGRTGHFFAYQRLGIEPDIMAVAKGIGGGFPMGACLATAEIAAAMVPGTHGTTYGGNPLAMAVGNAVLDVVLADGFFESVRERGRDLTQGLASLVDTYPDIFTEFRGEGLLRGLKCKVPNKDVVAAARDENLLLVGAGDNVVRLLPPLIISQEDLSEGVAALGRAAEKLRANNAESA